nr:hypothetical protein [Microctonus hyperodae filamentous virus]
MLSIRDVRDADVSTWSGTNSLVKLTLNEVCLKLGLDIINDRRNAFFWNIQLHQRVVINEDLLDWLGYRGNYHIKKNAITKLLKKNPHIQYNEISDDHNVQRKYYVLDAIDFESLLMLMRTERIMELRHLFSLTKFIVTKYCEYERYHEKHMGELLKHQNTALTQSVQELKSLVMTVKEQGNEREAKAQEERRRAEEREARAEEERRRAEEREARAEERSARLSTQISKKCHYSSSAYCTKSCTESHQRSETTTLGFVQLLGKGEH